MPRRIRRAVALTSTGLLLWAIALSAQPAGMVPVRAATYVMGTDPARIDALMARFGVKRRELFAAEIPARTASVRAFFMDATEVTNAAFKDFTDRHPEWSPERLTAERHNGDYLKSWNSGTYAAGEGEYPVTFVTWHAAAAYCGSVGKRLPTEAEWELAAGGGAAAEFPWGDDPPDATKANYAATGLGKPARVRSFPPARGLYDMAGNVWEFVNDRWDDQRYVIRGGSFGGAPVNLRVRFRDSHPALGAGPHVGFRCARSAEVDNK